MRAPYWSRPNGSRSSADETVYETAAGPQCATTSLHPQSRCNHIAEFILPASIQKPRLPGRSRSDRDARPSYAHSPVIETVIGNNFGDLLPFLALPFRLSKTRTSCAAISRTYHPRHGQQPQGQRQQHCRSTLGRLVVRPSAKRFSRSPPERGVRVPIHRA